MIEPRLTNLDRYVLPVDQPLPLEGGGFLDLSPHGGYRGDRGVARPVVEVAATGSSFVLLAPGGAGKTTVLRALRQMEPDATEIDLRVLDKTGMNDALRDALATGRLVYLDALDEVALHEPLVFRLIEHHLASPMAKVLSWRLACRPAAWNPDLAAALKALPGFEEFRLLPLTRAQVKTIATVVEADPDTLVTALETAGLSRLAAAPRQLETAARRWAAGEPLPADRVEAIELEVRGMLGESDQGRRQPELSTDQQYRVAGRMAAIGIFSGITRFAPRGGPAPALLPISALPTSPEPGRQQLQIGSREYQEVIGTALFDPAPESSLVFRHQQYAEFLAARYLTARGITARKLRNLLGVQSDGTVPGQMIGTLVWLAAIQPELVSAVVRRNAVALVRAGADLPSPEVRAAVVDGLLTQSAAGDIDMLWGADLSALAHPGIEQQLRNALRHPDRPEHLWWISKVAEAADVPGLADPLVEALFAKDNWFDWAMEAAISAVAALGGDGDRARLKPLLHLDRSRDPNDEVFTAVVEALYPRLLTTPELLEVLRPRRNTGYFGGYIGFLRQLDRKISTEDLPAVLTWAADQVAKGEDAFGSLIPDLVQRGWDEGDLPSVADALAELVVTLLREHDRDWYQWSRSNRLPWIDDIERRLHLAVAVGARLGREADYYLIAVKLLTSADAEWLISSMPAIAESAQAALAPCVPYLVQQPTAAVADLILGMAEDHPAYEWTRPLRDSIDIESETARRWRELHAADADHPPVGATEDQRRNQLTSALREAADAVDKWWRVVFWLSVDPNGRLGEPLFTHDLSARPGWSLLDAEQQRQVVDIGLDYVADHRPTPGRWLGAETVRTDDAMPDWAGVYLLTTLAQHEPERLAVLDLDAWRRWAPAITAAWNFDREVDTDPRCTLVDLAPLEAREVISMVAVDQLDVLNANDRHVASERLYRHLLPEVAPELADRMAAGRYHGQLARTMLGLLVELAPNVALGTCWTLARGNGELASDARQRLAVLDPPGAVNEFSGNSAWTESLTEVAPRLRLDALDASHLALLARFLLTRFAIHDDPPPLKVGAGVNAERETRSVRDRALLRLADDGDVDALQALATEFPNDRPIFATLLRDARRHAADLAFTPVTPNGLVALLDQGEARLVRHDRDLVDVVIEQLDQIQQDLRTGAYRDVWNLGNDPRPKSEDDISDWVKRQLSLRMTHGLIVDRETQVMRRQQQGIGTRIDLAATATTSAQPPDVARVIIEAKLINNRQLLTSLQRQLVDRYLVPSGQRHGIYLVYWVDSSQRPAAWQSPGSSDRDELREQLDTQASNVGNRQRVAPYILDVSRSHHPDSA